MDQHNNNTKKMPQFLKFDNKNYLYLKLLACQDKTVTINMQYLLVFNVYGFIL